MLGKSLRNYIENDIQAILSKINFESNPDLLESVLALIDLFSSYHEEGKTLYPEVLIFVNNPDDDFFKYLSGEKKHIIHNKLPLKSSNFKKTIKSLAPLCQNDWISFCCIEPDYKNFSSGVISVVENEISISIQNQLLEFKPEEFTIPFLFISSFGNRNVMLRGIAADDTLISFSLKKENEILELNLESLVNELLKTIPQEESRIFSTYTSNLFQKSFREGHGNLIAVVNDDSESIALAKKVLKGIYLNKSIDYYEKLSNAYKENNLTNNYDLRQHTALLSNILNFDGITLFTNKFKLLGYNMFIKNEIEDTEDGGGARTRAYNAMVASKTFRACFFKSQDGNEKINIIE